MLSAGIERLVPSSVPNGSSAVGATQSAPSTMCAGSAYLLIKPHSGESSLLQTCSSACTFNRASDSILDSMLNGNC